MKLFFVVTGIGLGHATRIEAVLNAVLKKDKKCKIKIAGYKSSYTYFKNKGFKVIKLIGVNYSSEKFKVNIFNILRTNLKYPLNFRRDVKTLMNNIKEFDPDYVIVDWELSGLIAASNLNKKSLLIFNYDPFTFESFLDKFMLGRTKVLQSRFVETIYAVAEKRSMAIFIPGLKYEVKNKFHFIDFVVREKYNEVEDEEKLMEKLRLRKKPILVMLGGSNFGYDLFEKMKDVIFEIKNEDFIVFGYKKNFKKKNIVSFKFRENYLEYLKASKGVIMLAGHSSFAECAVFKKPCLVFPIRGHVEQMLNAFTIEKTGIAMVKYLSKIKKEEIEKDLNQFMHNLENLQERANILNARSDGAEEVVRFLFMEKSEE